MSFVLFETDEHVGVLTINRPQALNALNSEVVAELSARLDGIAQSGVRCLIVTGAGEKAFVAGADIGEMKELDPAGARRFSDEGNALMEKLENLPMPVIAAVNGFALGGGCELAISCDIRLASDNAVFALPEVGLGIMPGYGGVQRLSRLVGIARAKEMAYTTNRIKAPEALAIGLVNNVYPACELMGEAMKMAEKIASNAPVGVRGVKRAANDSVGLTLREAACLEASLFADCFATRDQKQAMAAFLEKRKPDPFTGS